MSARIMDKIEKKLEIALTASWRRTGRPEKDIPKLRGTKLPHPIDVVSEKINVKLERLSSINKSIKLARVGSLAPETLVSYFVETSYMLQTLDNAELKKELDDIKPIVDAASKLTSTDNETKNLIDALQQKKDVQRHRDALNVALKKHIQNKP